MASSPNQDDKRRRGRKPANPSSKLVPAKQAGDEIGVPYTSLRDRAQRGELDHLRIGRNWYFRRDDLKRFIDGCQE